MDKGNTIWVTSGPDGPPEVCGHDFQMEPASRVMCFASLSQWPGCRHEVGSKLDLPWDAL